MGDAPDVRWGRRARRARRFRRSRRGIVSVIGTLLALLVFFALFGVFLTQYVPLWMTDNESAFSAQVAASFALLKSNIDQQYALGGPTVLGTPFTLASQGVPLIAQPTEGTLAFLPTTCPGGFYTKGASGATSANYGQPVNSSFCEFANVTLTTGPGSSGYYTQRVATGILQMLLPNRYYTEQTYFMEDDAVIQVQPNGYQTMDFAPPLNVTKASGNTSVSTTLLQMYGNASTVLGQGTQEVYSHYRFTQVVTSVGTFVSANSSYLPFKFLFQIGTQYPCAWYAYLANIVKYSGIPATSIALSPSTAPTTSACAALNGLTSDITLTVSNVNYASTYFAGVQLSLGEGAV